MSEHATRDQFEAIVSGQDDLVAAAAGLQLSREQLVRVSRHVDAAERYDVHIHVAKAISAVDDALSQLTAEGDAE